MAKAKKPSAGQAKKKKKKSPLRGGSRVPMERLRLVETMMSASCSRRDVVLKVVEKFGVTEKTAYGYYEMVEREWQEEAKPKRRFRRANALKRLEAVFKMAMAGNRPSAAVRAVEAIAKLDGLYEPDEIIVHTDMHPTETMTSAQRRAYIVNKRTERETLLARLVREDPKPTSIN